MIGNKRKPFKAPGKQTQSNPSIQVQIQIEEAKIRKLEILKSLQESNEIEKVQGLICKWREACIEAIGTIREKIGKTIIHQTTKSYQEEIGWDSKQAIAFWKVFVEAMNEKKQVILKVDQESPQDDTESTERKYTLKEICERFGFDVEMLGDYDPENDCFN